MATISLTSTTATGFLQTDFDELKGSLQIGDKELGPITIGTGATLGFTDNNAIDEFSTDGTLAGDSDLAVPTEKAVKLYVDTNVPSTNLTINATSSAYSLTSDDNGEVIHVSGTTTITLPDSLDTGFNCTIVNVDSNTVSLSATTTLNTKDSATDLANQYGAATVYHAGSNVWYGYGDLS